MPEHLPRETHTHMPAEEDCSACGGGLSKLGEDVSEMLEYIPASLKVIRHASQDVLHALRHDHADSGADLTDRL
jgi:transposase